MAVVVTLLYRDCALEWANMLIVARHVGTHGSCVRSNGMSTRPFAPWWADARAVRPYILLPYFVHFLLIKGHEKANKGNSLEPFVYRGYALLARAYAKTFKRQVR